MIECPRCGSYDVTEERIIPIPTGELPGCVRVLFWPFRKPGIYIITSLVTLLVVGFMLPINRFFTPAGQDSGLARGLTSCEAALLLGLYAVIMSLLPVILTKAVLPLFSGGKGQDNLERIYRRTCRACEFCWTYNPKEPDTTICETSTVTPIEPDQTIVKGEHKTRKPSATMPFQCPECGHTSSFDSRVDSAHCPQCGYSPSIGKGMRSTLQRKRIDAYLPYLRDLVSHWEGEHTPDPTFSIDSPETAVDYFQSYQRSLGEDLHPTPGHYYTSGYLRKYNPTRQQILDFMDAYSDLKRGDEKHARQKLTELTRKAPKFVEPWLWLTAVTEGTFERRHALETASLLEPAHPMVVDALAIVRGEVSLLSLPGRKEQSALAEAQHCPHCGGSLTFTPGDHEIECPYCGDLINLKTTDILNRPTPLVSTIRLQRKILARHWNEIDRVLSCDACGARLTMTHHLARKCAFCGSANVLVEDPQIALEQPDGFLPFEINKRDVDKAIRREKPSILWDYRGWDRFRRMKVQNLLGVYMPFWVFDGVVNPMWAWLREDGTLARTNSPGSEIDFNNIIFPGTDRPHPSLLDDVSEYDMSKLVMYEPKLLADWSAMLYNIDVEIAVEDAYDAMIALAHQKLGPPVLAGVDVPEGSRAVRTLQVSHTTYQLVLLPLWIARLTSEDTDAVALVNGQTGASIFRMRYRD